MFVYINIHIQLTLLSARITYGAVRSACAKAGQWLEASFLLMKLCGTLLIPDQIAYGIGVPGLDYECTSSELLCFVVF